MASFAACSPPSPMELPPPPRELRRQSNGAPPADEATSGVAAMDGLGRRWESLMGTGILLGRDIQRVAACLS